MIRREGKSVVEGDEERGEKREAEDGKRKEGRKGGGKVDVLE